MNKKEARAKALTIAALADEGGIIQAGEMLGISNNPMHHTTCRLRQAWKWSGLKPKDFGASDWDAAEEIIWC